MQTRSELGQHAGRGSNHREEEGEGGGGHSVAMAAAREGGRAGMEDKRAPPTPVVRLQPRQH